MAKGRIQGCRLREIAKSELGTFGWPYNLVWFALLTFEAVTTSTPKPFSPSFSFDTALATAIPAFAPSQPVS